MGENQIMPFVLREESLAPHVLHHASILFTSDCIC